jgi:hypothetical protein
MLQVWSVAGQFWDHAFGALQTHTTVEQVFDHHDAVNWGAGVELM